MRIITRYLFKTVASAIGVSLLAILGVDFIFTLLNELRFVGKGDYTLMNAFVYLLMTLPRHVSEMFPFAVLLGSVMGLSILAAHSELLVLQSMGFSARRITLGVIKTVAILVCLVGVSSEWIAPKLEQLADSERANRLSKGQMVKSAGGAWLRDDKTFIHVREWVNANEAMGVTRYLFNEKQELVSASFSSRAKVHDQQWELIDTRETVFYKNATQAHFYKTLKWQNRLKTDVMGLLGENHPERLPLSVLRELIRYRLMNQLETRALELAFYQRLMQPIAILLMLVLALPFVFGPLRSTSRGLKMLLGMGLGFGFYVLNGILPQLSFLLSSPAWFSAALPSLLFILLGLWVAKHPRKH